MDEGARPLAIVGAGSVGQVFAGLIAASGQPITLLATPGTTAQLLEAGAIRLHGVVSRVVPAAPTPAAAGTVGVTADPTRLAPGSGLIFATKGHQLPAAVAAVRAAWRDSGDTPAWVAGVQNGLVKDDVLAEAFGRECAVGAVTILGGERQGDGTVLVTSLGATYFGELGGGTSRRVAAVAETFNRAGIPTDATPDIQSALWSKACNAVGVFGVTVLTRLSGTRAFRHPSLVRAYLGLVRETAAVAAAYGVELGDYPGFPIRTYVARSDEETLAAFEERRRATPRPSGPESYPSMVQDFLAGRPLEADEIFADMVQRAERVGVPVPRITFVRDVLRGVDPGHAIE